MTGKALQLFIIVFKAIYILLHLCIPGNRGGLTVIFPSPWHLFFCHVHLQVYMYVVNNKYKLSTFHMAICYLIGRIHAKRMPRRGAGWPNLAT